MNPGATGGYIRNAFDNLGAGGATARRRRPDAESTKLAKLMTDAVGCSSPDAPGST